MTPTRNLYPGIKRGDGCANKADPLFDAKVELPVARVIHPRGSMDDRLIAVTSLAPNNIRQLACLRSWRDFGLSVAVRNTAAEIEKLRPTYGHLVNHWIADDQTAIKTWGKPLQRIDRLAKTAVEFGTSVMIINADIQIIGEQARLVNQLRDDSMTIGIRWDYHTNHADAVRQKWGIDAFVISPKLAAALPESDFAMGRPGWDYWLPIAAKQNGYQVNAVGDRLFYHQAHSLNWSKANWKTGADMIQSATGLSIHSDSGIALRQSLPYKPHPNKPTPKILFHHVAKTAGSSVTDWLKSHYQPKAMWETKWDGQRQSVNEWNNAQFDRRPIRLITGHGAVGCNVPSDWRKLIILRDPVERFVSYVNYRRQLGDSVTWRESLTRYKHVQTEYRRLGGVDSIVREFDLIGFIDQLPDLISQLNAIGFGSPWIQRLNVSKSTRRPSASDLNAIRQAIRDEQTIYDQLRKR